MRVAKFFVVGCVMGVSPLLAIAAANYTIAPEVCWASELATAAGYAAATVWGLWCIHMADLAYLRRENA